VLAIVERDYRVVRSYHLMLFTDLVYGVVALAAYYFISETVGDIPSTDLHGAPTYFAFAAVGAVLGIIIQAASTTIALRVREEQLTGTLEALASQPLTATEICLGFIGFQYLLAAVRVTLYLALATVWIELDVTKASWIGVAVMLVASAFGLALIGVLAGALVLGLKRGSMAVTGLGLSVMGILAGAVFPVEVLPDWLEVVSLLVPLRYALDGLRAAMFEGGGWGGDALVLVGFGLGGLPLAVGLFAAVLRLVERRGSLAQY
jgi:ABC-2 type transport system permease protein